MNRLRARTQRRELWRKLNRARGELGKAPWAFFTTLGLPAPVEGGNHAQRRQLEARLRRQFHLETHPRGLQPRPPFSTGQIKLLEQQA